MRYEGEAAVSTAGRVLRVPVRLSGRFEPVEGRFRWAGRCGAAALTEAFHDGVRDVTVRIDGGLERPARLGDPDPWGRIRLTGTGSPPWPVSPGR